jgi:hypothetical protein
MIIGHVLKQTEENLPEGFLAKGEGPGNEA